MVAAHNANVIIVEMNSAVWLYQGAKMSFERLNMGQLMVPSFVVIFIDEGGG